MSTSYFSTAFKVSFGMSPHNYILSRRIGHAKLRMIESDAPLCEIALDCGLADQAHLCRVFRRITGTTPSSWRRLAAHPDASDAASLRSAA
nr:helix-turn-helix transcriptional regulator [Neorhizobium alkalisoli]